jgi:hypothetical protein
VLKIATFAKPENVDRHSDKSAERLSTIGVPTAVEGY